MLIYQLLIRLLSPVIWVLIVLEAIKTKGGWAFFLQRLGLHYPKPVQPSLQPIWIHCASVGEVKAAEPLVRALLTKHTILLTTNTVTSRALVTDIFGDQVQHCYLPLDWPFALNRLIQTFQPQKLWVLETEIWPNLFHVAKKHNLQLCILNGRLTPKTFRAPAWLQSAYKNSLTQVDKVIARSNNDAALFAKLGVSPAIIEILGNLKYSAQPQQLDQIRPLNREYILAASTHQDEELKITQAWLKLEHSALLVIVPRHPKRTQSIQKQLAFLGDALKVASKSEQVNQQTRVFLDDRIGKLVPLYAFAKIVIMGGSFVRKGGHNILEPAAFKKPILTGLDHADFEEEMALLIKHNGIIQCTDYLDLHNALTTLLQQPDKAKIMGENAYQALQEQKNTLKNYLFALNED